MTLTSRGDKKLVRLTNVKPFFVSNISDSCNTNNKHFGTVEDELENG